MLLIVFNYHMELAEITFPKKEDLLMARFISEKYVITLNRIVSKLVCKNKTFFVDGKAKSNLE